MNKSEILESYAITYQAERYPPLAGKIIGLFMITGKKHLSFDEIKDELDVSKGALSKMLNLLIDINRITYIKDSENSRKRLFCIDVAGINKHLQSIVENFEWQNNLLINAKKLRENSDPEIDEFIDNSLEFSRAMLKQLKMLTEKHFN